jgi:hypothetical protein
MVVEVARTSTLCNLQLCLLEQALRLISPSSSSSRMPSFCLQVRILRFVAAGRILKEKRKKEQFSLFKKTKGKAVMKEQRKKYEI